MAELLKVAAIALGLARVAHLAPVMDQLVGERDPALLWHNPHQLLLHVLRRVPLGQAQPPRNPEDMRVHHYALSLAKADAEDHVGCFARRAGNASPG